jgi:MFS family permease
MTPAGDAGHPRAAFRHRDFRLALAGSVASVVAMQMQSVAIGWQVYDLTHRPLDLGFVGLAQFVPAILLSLIAGQTADRFDRRGILRICQLAQVVCSQALLPHLVPTEDFANAVTWAHSVRQVASMVGPAVGGVIYGAASGAGLVYAACAGLYVVAFFVTTLIEARTGRLEKEVPTWTTLLAGVRFVWREKIVLGCISLDLFAVLLGGAVALLPVYARDILHVGPRGLGLLRSAPAIGAAVMGAYLAYHPLRRKVGRTMFAAVAVFGLATIVFGISTSFTLSLAALFVTGAADMVSVVIRLTLVQLSTPGAMRGRVSAVNMAFINASNELGEFESGVTAALLGTVAAVVVGGAGTCVVVLLWAYLFPEIRALERLTDAKAAEPAAASPTSASPDIEAVSLDPVAPELARKLPDHSK